MLKLLLVLLLLLSGCASTEPTTLERCSGYSVQQKPGAAKCYFEVAMNEKDHTICENIIGESNIQTRIQCYNDVASMSRNDTICDLMIVENYSYLDMAKQSCKQYVMMR